MGDNSLRPTIMADTLIEDAARRAFNDMAAKYYSQAGDDLDANLELREQLLKTVDELGFCDALPDGHDPDTWPDAAAIIQAQARSGAPIDMVAILIQNDRTSAIAVEPGHYMPDGAACSGGSASPADRVTRLTALGRCLQLSGAMHAAVDMSLQYVQDRKQFGRPLAAFQVIQHRLAVAAEEAAAATAITDLCVARLVTGGDSDQFMHLLDSAALVTCYAATEVYDAAHQVHGAIGFTKEYALHRHTISLLCWQDDLRTLLGSRIDSAVRLGEMASNGSGVWRTTIDLMGRSSPQ